MKEEKICIVLREGISAVNNTNTCQGIKEQRNGADAGEYSRPLLAPEPNGSAAQAITSSFAVKFGGSPLASKHYTLLLTSSYVP